MVINDAASILVIIISSVLAIFLILAIFLVVMLMRVTRQIKEIAETAQTTADHFANVAVNMSKVTTPAFIGKTLLEQLKRFKK